jgi:HTH domain
MDFSEKYSMQDIMDIAKVSRATIYNHLEKLNEIGATKMMNNKRVFSERAIEFLKGEDRPILGKIVNKEDKEQGLSKEENSFEFINYIQKQMLHFQSEVKRKEEQILTKDRIIMLKDEQLISRDEIIKAKDKEINQLTQKLIGLYEQEKINQELLVSKKKKTIFNFFKRR